MATHKYMIPALLALPVGWLLIAGSQKASQAAGAGATTEVAVTASSAQMPVLNTWFALGSGCRARSDAPGDVSMERVPQDPARPNVYRARFHLDSYQAASDALGENPPVKFARECAVRLNINPPAGMKLVNLHAATDVIEDKGPGVKLTVRDELKLGNATLGLSDFVYDQGKALFHHDDAVSLTPGTNGLPMPALKCAEPKIIGFDYTFLVERPSAADEVHVQLNGAKTLEIEAELAPCS
jgi:hypothetical protein